MRVVQVERGDHGAAAALRGHVGAPDIGGEEVVAEQVDAYGGQVAQGPLVVLDLLVPAGQAALDLPEVGERDVLQAVDRQPVGVAAFPQGPQFGQAPEAVGPGQQVGCVQLHAGERELVGEGRDAGVVPVDVAQGDTDGHACRPSTSMILMVVRSW